VRTGARRRLATETPARTFPPCTPLKGDRTVSILWIIIVVLVVLALLGFVGRGRW
jgi:hypothetical protein